MPVPLSVAFVGCLWPRLYLALVLWCHGFSELAHTCTLACKWTFVAVKREKGVGGARARGGRDWSDRHVGGWRIWQEYRREKMRMRCRLTVSGAALALSCVQ